MQVTATDSLRMPSMWNVECHLRRSNDLKNLTQVSAARAVAAAMTGQATQDGLTLFLVNSPVVHPDIGRPSRRRPPNAAWLSSASLMTPFSSVGTAGGL
jgi:hypothetical protein